MTTQPVVPSDRTSPMAQIMQAQLAWQQLCWGLVTAGYGMGWRVATALPRVVAHSHKAHDQLEVPSDIAAAGEHALFA